VSITFAAVRRAVAFGLLALGILFVAAAASPAQTTTPPPTAATTAPPTSSTPSSTLPKVATAGGGGSRLPTLGEGFPWITVGVVILVAGLVGARLRRASRR
jgi:hypothetical protein